MAVKILKYIKSRKYLEHAYYFNNNNFKEIVTYK